MTGDPTIEWAIVWLAWTQTEGTTHEKTLDDVRIGAAAFGRLSKRR
jgi:hypothetical protein